MPDLHSFSKNSFIAHVNFQLFSVSLKLQIKFDHDKDPGSLPLLAVIFLGFLCPFDINT